MGLFRRDPWRNPPDQEVEVETEFLSAGGRDALLRTSKGRQRPASSLHPQMHRTLATSGSSVRGQCGSSGTLQAPSQARRWSCDALRTRRTGYPELPSALAPTSRWRLRLPPAVSGHPGSVRPRSLRQQGDGHAIAAALAIGRHGRPCVATPAGRRCSLPRPSMPRVKCIGVDAG